MRVVAMGWCDLRDRWRMSVNGRVVSPQKGQFTFWNTPDFVKRREVFFAHSLGMEVVEGVVMSPGGSYDGHGEDGKKK